MKKYNKGIINNNNDNVILLAWLIYNNNKHKHNLRIVHKDKNIGLKYFMWNRMQKKYKYIEGQPIGYNWIGIKCFVLTYKDMYGKMMYRSIN
jgi:hypothetical protein